MAHTSEKRWNSVVRDAVSACTEAVNSLLAAENHYQDLVEMYQYAGGTAQGVADLLFEDEWSSRTIPGTPMELEVDVVAGEVTNPVIVAAGTDYTDATGYTVRLTNTAGGGDQNAIIKYDVVSGSVTNLTVSAAGSGYVDGTGYTVLEIEQPGFSYETQANADEVSKAQDLIDAMTALHGLYQAADNVAVAQEDRFSAMRRFT